MLDKIWLHYLNVIIKKLSVILLSVLYLAVCLFIDLSVSPSVCMSVYLSICLPACLSICLPVSVCLSVCVPVALLIQYTPVRPITDAVFVSSPLQLRTTAVYKRPGRRCVNTVEVCSGPSLCSS